MAIPTPLVSLVGDWKGTSRLNCSWPPDAGEQVKECDSRVQIVSVGDEFAEIRYTWQYEGADQTGLLILAGPKDGTDCTGGWSDTWHLNAAVMALKGTILDEKLALNGSYSMEGYPDWFWRIEFASEGDALALRMFNISPEGEEDWATDAVYTRA